MISQKEWMMIRALREAGVSKSQVAHITYATGDDPHIISIIPEAIPSLDYLISQECLHALRLFDQPEMEKRIPRSAPEY